MQANTSKHILLLLVLFLLPIVLLAQAGRKKYVTRSGDTTIIVKNSTGLYGADAAFLLDERATKNYLDKHSRYQRLKEAVQETGQVANIVEAEKIETQPSTSSLSFRAAQQNIRVIQNDREAQRIAQSDRYKESTVEELAYIYKKYGEKPSYFVNGQAIAPEKAELIPDNEVLSKSFKVGKTVTGNPNGEVWYVVPTKTIDRLKLGDPSEVYYAEAPAKTIAPKTAPVVRPAKVSKKESVAAPVVIKPQPRPSVALKATYPATLDRLTQEDMKSLSSDQRKQLASQEKTIATLRTDLAKVQRDIANYSAETDQLQQAKTTPAIAPAYTPAAEPKAVPATPIERPATAVKRTTPKEKEEVFSFRDSPQEKTRRERDQQQVTETAVETAAEVKEDSPKRSVRKIKERERSR